MYYNFIGNINNDKYINYQEGRVQNGQEKPMRGTPLKTLLENTKHCKSPRHFWLDKIICEHLYELVITIIVLLRHAVYTVSLSLLSVHHYFVYSFCITEL